jgi:predicted Co/Zn/Cd cation transporter (cation efflux family)
MKAIEDRSLNLAKWANLVMGIVGIIAAIASHASALMLDGLFSGVNFLAAVLATRVTASIQRKPDAMRPFGYEIDESMYVMFRSLVLSGIIIVALFNATDKIVTYASGGHIPEVKLDWVVGYMIFMVIICFTMAMWHHRNWIKTDRQSDLLKTERSASLIDGILSTAAGAAFLVIALLKQTSLSFLVPISDAIIVIGLALYMIPKPVGSFLEAAKEVLGESAPRKVVDSFRETINNILVDKPYTLLQVAVTKTGRKLFAVPYIKPGERMSVQDLDRLRTDINQTCQTKYGPLRMEIIFTGRIPYE